MCRKSASGQGIELNAKQTEAMCYNTNIELIDTIDGTEIKQAKIESGDQAFMYLGCYCSQCRDSLTWKALTWQSLNKLSNVWKSNLSKTKKINLFRATTETILIYWDIYKAR